MKKILALDPATYMGFAYCANGATVSGTWDLSVRRDESGGMRLVRLQSKLNELLASGVDLVVFEAARHAAPGMQNALVVQSEIQAVVKLWCEVNKLDYRGYSPSEVKKIATGKGNADKKQVIAAAKSRLGWDGKGDDNEADALWLLQLALRDYANASVPELAETKA